MKRFFLLILTVILLLAALPAHAHILYFPEGTTLHRDPLCPHVSLTTDYFYAETVLIESFEALSDDAHFAPCEHCQYPLLETTSVDTPLYYNPDGGSRFHYDQECPMVSEKSRPLTPLPAEIGNLLPCVFCRPLSGYILLQLADTTLWNASIEEKAQLLPGIWTLPGSKALPVDAACTAARAYLAEHFPDEICTITAMHYDDGLNPGDGHETYRLLATTALHRPLCIISVDALTGDIYRVQPAADMH